MSNPQYYNNNSYEGQGFIFKLVSMLYQWMLSQLQFKVECFSQEEDKFVYLINWFRKVAFKNSLILDFLYLANTTNKDGEKKIICKKKHLIEFLQKFIMPNIILLFNSSFDRIHTNVKSLCSHNHIAIETTLRYYNFIIYQNDILIWYRAEKHSCS